MRLRSLMPQPFSLAVVSLLCVLLSADLLWAQQTGTITGRVTGQAGESLTGATVRAEGTRRGTLTDAEGRYSLAIEPGTYTIRVRFIGYRPGSGDVTVRAGETVSLDFELGVDPLALQELVVTATSGARPANEATLSMSVIPEEKMERFEPTSAADVLQLVPGIHSEGGGGEVAVNSFIRGLPSGGQFRYQTLQEDGIPLRTVAGGEFSAEDVFFRHDLNVQTLEVAKGGVATVYGLSSPGGIINYRTHTGGPELRSKMKVTVAERDLYRLDFNTNGPLGEDYRFNIGGFYRYDLGPRVSGLPSEGLQLKGNITKLLENGHVRAYLTYIDDRAQFLLPFAHERVSGEPAIDEDGTQNSAQAADFTIPTPFGQFESTMANGVLTKGARVMFEYLSGFGDGWSVENKFRWSDFEHEFNIFIPFVPQFADSLANTFQPDPATPTHTPIYTFTDNGQPFTGSVVIRQGLWARFRPTEDLANQLTIRKAVTAGNTSHLFTLGAYLARTEVTDRQIRPTGLFELATEPRMLDLILVDASVSPADTIVVTRSGLTEVSNNYFNRSFGSNMIAIFGGDEIVINDRLRIDLGARYERLVADARVEGSQNFVLGLTTVAESRAVFGNGVFRRRNIEFDDVAVAVGANYGVTDYLNAYGTFSRSFFFPPLGSFAGNVALDSAGNFVQPQPSGAERFIQFEGGLKLTSPELSGTVAGYYVKVNDRQQTDIKIVDGQSVQIQDVVGESRTFGAEVTAAYAPRAAPGLSVESSLTLQDLENTDFIIGTDTLSGNQPQRQPKFILNSSLFYSRLGFDFMLNWHHLGPRFADDANLQELEAFDVLSVNAGYTLPLADGNTLRLGVNVYNLNDTIGLTEGDPRLPAGVDPASFPFFNARPVLPRRIRVTATYSF